MTRLKLMARAGLLLALALAVQTMSLPPQVTGIVVNAVLVATAILVHPVAAVVVGLVTPWVALITGILGLPYMAPYIMAANGALVLGYTLAKRHGDFVGVVAGAFAKYLTFIAAINLLLPAFGLKLPGPAMVMFGLQQLVTALVGGLVALVVAETISPVVK